MPQTLMRKKMKSNHSEVAQSCPTPSDPMDCSLPGSSVHGILQARILEWVAISFSKGSSQPRDRTWVSRIGGRCFNLWATRKAPASPVGLYIVVFAFTSPKVSGYLFLKATPVPLLLAGGCVFLGLWLRKGCWCFLSQDFAQISIPLPSSPLCLPSTSQVCSALISSVGFSFKPRFKILSLSPKPSISRYPKSPYLGTELLYDFIWCFMSLSLWKEAQFFEWFRVQERSFKYSIPLFFAFFFHQLSCVCPHLTHLACHSGPKELRDLVQMMGSQRLKPIMVSFMLYWGHPQWCEALCRGVLRGSHVKSGA